jgi:uncharacterized protein (TIGR00369 family)
VYPPDRHVLRDLRFTFEHAPEDRHSKAWMPVVPEICTDQGAARAGALATLVDVIGGGLAAATQPDWIATADLSLHVVGDARPGSVVEAAATVQRSGRTTVVIEVVLVDEAHRHDIGIATMSFSVLPRRDINPDMSEVRRGGLSTMTTEASALQVPFAEALGVEVRDASAGVLDVPVTDWARNSMGAMQGGIVATVAEMAAETALRETTGTPVVVRDIHMTYLGFGRVGPVRSRTEVRNATRPGWAFVRLSDSGADDRVMAHATARAANGFAG